MPKAALFCSRYLAYSQTFIYEEIRQHREYDVHVFCRSLLNRDTFPFHPIHTGGAMYPYTRYSRRFVDLFRTTDYDVVHAHFGTAGVNAAYYAKRFAKPLLVTFHGWDVPILTSTRRWLPKHWAYAAMAPSMLGRMTLGLCASRELMDMLIRMGVPASRLRLHHIGIDLERFARNHRAGDSPRVVMIGRFVEKKGFEYGIRAFAKAEHPTAKLTIVGDGALGTRLRTLVSRLGVSDRVRFAGVMDQSSVARLLGESDVLLAPSIVAKDGNRESGLIVVKEASASEVVPIGTIHGGIPEIIDDGKTGFLVPERDVALMAERLGQLFRDHGLRDELGKAARRKMEVEYDSVVRVARLEALYDEARSIFAAQGRAGGAAQAVVGSKVPEESDR
jgi:colanic acid/amylovoran/stewartan biosynthesis glycosyltransferase WcaL/AmsK/CpsK